MYLVVVLFRSCVVVKSCSRDRLIWGAWVDVKKSQLKIIVTFESAKVSRVTDILAGYFEWVCSKRRIRFRVGGRGGVVKLFCLNNLLLIFNFTLLIWNLKQNQGVVLALFWLDGGNYTIYDNWNHFVGEEKQNKFSKCGGEKR